MDKQEEDRIRLAFWEQYKNIGLVLEKEAPDVFKKVDKAVAIEFGKVAVGLVGAVGGGYMAVNILAWSGTVAGLNAAGITGGLATLGSILGGVW